MISWKAFSIILTSTVLPQGSLSLERHRITRHWFLLALQQLPKLPLQVKVKLKQISNSFTKDPEKEYLFNVIPREFKLCKWSQWITERAKRIIIPQQKCKGIKCLEWILLRQNITICCKRRIFPSFCFLFYFKYFCLSDLIFIEWINTVFKKTPGNSIKLHCYVCQRDESMVITISGLICILPLIWSLEEHQISPWLLVGEQLTVNNLFGK